jgi:hypothetical protein
MVITRPGWWLNELESLGINTREESQLKDFKKTTELTTDVKQMFYEEYQKAFSESLWAKTKLLPIVSSHIMKALKLNSPIS